MQPLLLSTHPERLTTDHNEPTRQIHSPTSIEHERLSEWKSVSIVEWQKKEKTASPLMIHHQVSGWSGETRGSCHLKRVVIPGFDPESQRWRLLHIDGCEDSGASPEWHVLPYFMRHRLLVVTNKSFQSQSRKNLHPSIFSSHSRIKSKPNRAHFVAVSQNLKRMRRNC